MKKIFGIVLAGLIGISAAGCGTTYQEAIDKTQSSDYGGGYFTKILDWRDKSENYCIVYANDTKVKYLMTFNAAGSGITPLYNADGTLQIYEGE